MSAETESSDAEPPRTRPHAWVFGEAPLAQTVELAFVMRRVVGLALSVEAPDPAVTRLIEQLHQAERALLEHAPADPTPRLGINAMPQRRVYLNHGHDVGAYNPCFPEYEIAVHGATATGTVSFPLAFEGPPGIVHGGVLATFFDCVIQHHSCEVGVAGKTVSLQIRYRRPTPLGTALRFEIDRQVDERRINSVARLFNGDELLATATMEAVAGDHANLPFVSPRRRAP